MKRLFIALSIALPAVSLSGCAGGYGYGGGLYAGGPYAYDGYYDGFYGPIYDGYWGTDGGFYYRRGDHERGYRRGDPRHFHRDRAPSADFRPMQGSMTPRQGVRMPRFPAQREPRGGQRPR